MPDERPGRPHDDRPRVRVGGGFAREVSGIEFANGGVEVVEVERDYRDDPLVGVDLDDAEQLAMKCLGPLVSFREACTTEDEALPASCNHGRRYLHPDLGEGSHVRDVDFSTILDSG